MLSDPDLARVVGAAAAGDEDAWAQLWARFQNVAVAAALGWSGDLATAQDIAQDAFDLAVRHLPELDDPAAFPAWFRSLVRTALSRHHRGRRTIPASAWTEGTAADPAEVVLERAEVGRVRRAVEALPEPERTVIALHYLAGMPYPEVAVFLGIGVSAAKKRALVARRRLKEMLPMATDLLRASRPSGFRPSVALFRAIRGGDVDAVERLLDRWPELVGQVEDWTLDEAVAAGLAPAAGATPLVRAAGAADAHVVQALVARGADVNATCGCDGGESPLWAATVVGATDVVHLLLAAGADPSRPAFRGATPLHVAAQRGDGDVYTRLLEAGADPRRVDAGGRTAEAWLPSRRHRAQNRIVGGDMLETGIRVIDLLAPLRQGSAQRWSGRPGGGRLVVAVEVGRLLAPASAWWIGFEQDLTGTEEVTHALAELGASATVMLVDRHLDDGERRRRFEAVVADTRASGGPPKLVTCLEAKGHAHDVTAALALLRGAPGVLATLVLAPPDSRPPSAIPEGYDGQIGFDPALASRQVYPAIDPAATAARGYPSARHADLAARARAHLRSPAAPGGRLERYLAQPFGGAEPFSSTPGESTSLAEVLDTVEGMLDH